MLVWTDLEASGLSPKTDDVLEVAVIVTDDALNEVGRFERVIYSPKADVVLAALPDIQRKLGMVGVAAPWDIQKLTYDVPGSGIDPYVVRMHLDNGLWEAVRHGQSLATVDADLARFIQETAVREVDYVDAKTGAKKRLDRPQLAGSTISFDRGFIDAHLPKVAETLHYRNLDVSSFNEAFRRFYPPVYDARPSKGKDSAHRGMADIEESIRVFRHYMTVFKRAADAWTQDGGTLEELAATDLASGSGAV